MMQYSPYDNVKAQDYPAMLVHVSLNDSQVPYWEGAKLVARLRATKTDTNPLLLKTNLGAGHGGASGRYDALRETAFTYAFMLWQVGEPRRASQTARGPFPPSAYGARDHPSSRATTKRDDAGDSERLRRQVSRPRLHPV